MPRCFQTRRGRQGTTSMPKRRKLRNSAHQIGREGRRACGKCGVVLCDAREKSRPNRSSARYMDTIGIPAVHGFYSVALCRSGTSVYGSPKALSGGEDITGTKGRKRSPCISCSQYRPPPRKTGESYGARRKTRSGRRQLRVPSGELSFTLKYAALVEQKDGYQAQIWATAWADHQRGSARSTACGFEVALLS